MPSKKQPPASTSLCQVCKDQASKYRCPACPVRYCSVKCFKLHKESCATSSRPSDSDPESGTNGTAAPSLPPVTSADPNPDSDSLLEPTPTPASVPLRPLTSLSWPPEPDSSIFTDVLRRDDPKPLRHEELLRIATSPHLRDLLQSPRLPLILRALDTLSTSSARGSALARLLGVDPESLAQPVADRGSFLAARGSPPPLEDLLVAAARGTGGGETVSGAGESDQAMGGGTGIGKGWWLGVEENKVWVGDEEKRLMRTWAGVVVGAIDGQGGQGDEWGSGALAWDV